MPPAESDFQQLLNVSVSLGVQLLQCEAEIYRVEESLNRLLSAYGCATFSVFAIPSFLIVTVKDEAGCPLTQSARILQRDINLSQIDRLNHLCRRICRNTPPLSSVSCELKALERLRRYPPALCVITTGLIGLAFTLFFGGGLTDGICGALCGLVIGLSTRVFSAFPVNLYFSHQYGFRPFRPDRPVIRTIRPGPACGHHHHWCADESGARGGVTNSMRDAIGGDLIAGLLRLAQALITALAIALGVGLAIAVLP